MRTATISVALGTVPGPDVAISYPFLGDAKPL